MCEGHARPQQTRNERLFYAQIPAVSRTHLPVFSAADRREKPSGSCQNSWFLYLNSGGAEDFSPPELQPDIPPAALRGSSIQRRPTSAKERGKKERGADGKRGGGGRAQKFAEAPFSFQPWEEQVHLLQPKRQQCGFDQISKYINLTF